MILKNEKLAGTKLGINKDIIEVDKDGFIEVNNEPELLEALLASGFVVEKDGKSKAKKITAIAPKIATQPEIAPKIDTQTEVEPKIAAPAAKWSRK